MKGIKQKGQTYVGLDMRLEAAVDAILYHPRNRKGFQKNYRTGKYYRRFQRWRGFTRRKFGAITDLKLYACGVSHLDAAWLYPVVDTKERAYKTFYKAIEHCDLYPFLTFAQTAPQYYDWIRTYDSKLWEKVKEKVKEGRIELTGGMWVEPDLDMSSGESLVRQRLYGQLFFLREFGFYPTMESILDSFGFPWSLPQILLKSGATSFWTTKCPSSVPPAFYYWQGLDESRIFSYQFYYNWDALSAHKSFRKKARFPAAGAEGYLISSHLTNQEIETKFSQVPKDFNHHFPLFYGLGDGGRGPLEIEIMFADTLMQLHHGEHTSQHRYMEKMRQVVGNRYLVWNDEMFLHMHHGTKTTQMEIKHYHRRAEMWASAAETLLTLVNLQDPTCVPISKPEIFEMWRLILFNEFHDILPGSSIPDVYILAVKELKDSIHYAQQLVEKCLAKIKRTPSEVVVYNPFNWSRAEYVRDGNKVYFFANIPPLSIQTPQIEAFSVEPSTLDTIKETDQCFILENSSLSAKINHASGTLISLIHKASGKEMVPTEGTYKGLGSGLRVFIDKPRSRWKAWDIDKNYALHKIPWTVRSPAKKVVDATGETEIETTYDFLRSSAIVKFRLLPNDPYLRISIHIDLKDPQLLVKYFIPLTLQAQEVTSEIPYGVIARKRIKRTDLEKMKWETLMQKWIDISDPDVGMLIMNNNRYGFSTTMKGIYLTLARTALYPTVSPLYGSTRVIPPKERPKFTDLKEFDFAFGLLPHTKDWTQDHLWQQAFNFNLPLILGNETSSNINSTVNPGSFAQIDTQNVLIGAVKTDEWCGDMHTELKYPENWSWAHQSIILRLVEIEGKVTVSVLSLNHKKRIKQVDEVNLLEMDPKTIKIDEISPSSQQSISISLKPFEIKTLRIQFE